MIEKTDDSSRMISFFYWKTGVRPYKIIVVTSDTIPVEEILFAACKGLVMLQTSQVCGLKVVSV